MVDTSHVATRELNAREGVYPTNRREPWVGRSDDQLALRTCFRIFPRHKFTHATTTRSATAALRQWQQLVIATDCESMTRAAMTELPPSFGLWTTAALKRALRCFDCPIIEVQPTREWRSTAPGAFIESVIENVASKVILHSDHNKLPLAGSHLQSPRGAFDIS